MLEVSATAASVARACWMKYYFAQVMGYKPKKKKRDLYMGEVMHDSFHQLYSGKTHSSILQNILTRYDQAIKLADEPDREDLIVDKFTCLGMFEFYPQELHRFDKMDSEKEFSVRMAYGIRLVGRVDGDVMESGKRWIRELKVTGLSISQFKGRADRSYQVSGYKFGLEKLTGEPYQGVMFDVIRKPRLYKRVDDTAASFGKRIYDDYALTRTDYKKRESYFVRHFSYRSPFQMECFEQDMVKLAKEIRRRRRENDWQRNPDACWMYNRDCDYSTPCWSKVSQDAIEQMFDVRGKPTEVELNTEDFDG